MPVPRATNARSSSPPHSRSPPGGERDVVLHRDGRADAGSDTVAVAVSQSGGTEEIVEAMQQAARCGARTIAVTNGADSPLARGADLALVTAAGTELAVPATKTYTAQLVALAVLALAVGDEQRLLGRLDDVPEAVSRMLGTAEATAALAAELRDVERMVVTARGLALTTAREIALKLQEACHLAAVGLSAADLQHGPIAMLDARTPALLVASPADAAVSAGMVETARRARAAGAGCTCSVATTPSRPSRTRESQTRTCRRSSPPSRSSCPVSC